MGVPGLQTWLRRRYPEAFVPLPEGMAFDHVYIDMSSTLHQVIRRARTKSYFHSQLHRRLDDILALARPRQRVVLALDGPAPLAKLLEQRRRRRREVERSQRAAAAAAETAAADVAAAASGAAPPSGLIAGSTQQAWSSTVDALALQGGFRPPNPELSTLALTTGTRLMLEVHSSLAAYICKKLADPATAHLSFEFSDSTVKGEGELKILSRLLHPDSAVQPGDTHLVLGADSDLLLMALVSGQPGVYILNDLADGDSRRHHRHRRRSPRDAAAAAAVAAADAAAAAAAIAAAKALLAAPAAGLSSGEESDGDEVSSSGSDTEVESDESDSEPEKGEAAAAGGAGLPPGAHVRKLPALAVVATGAASQAEAVQPPPMAFSRDAAERLWREQHLAGGGGGPDEVTGLALDLMLLATMCSGNDYLPAIQGMQLSNKHRPGLWDLYCGMRQELRWAGQTLAVRGCDCGGAGAGHPGNDCPTISFNWPMLTALLSEYYRQRFVSLEGPNTAAVDPPRGTDPTAAPAGGMLASAILGSGSLSSVDLADSPAPVWGPEGLAAAAAQATAQQPGKPEGTAAAVVEGIELARQQRGRGPAVALRGLEPEPDSYLQGLEWVLQMYCSGAVRDYRFAYDLAAPSLTHLIAIMHQRSSSGSGSSGSSSSRSSSEVSETSAEGELQAGAAAAADEQAQQAQPRRRSTQPLVPAACAMALLPRGGRMHAATALQHLMDEGSQLEEIYATCDECTQLGLQLGSMGRELDGARVELAAAQLQLGELAAEALAGRAVTAPALELLEGEVERLEGEVARLRELVSALSRRQQEHLMDAHPYKPFPTEELEAAVAAVPLGAYPRRERKLAQFGREFVFRRAPAAAEAGDVACPPGLGPLSLQQQQQQQAAEEVGGARPGLEQAGGLATLALEERRPAAQAGAALSEQQQQQGERVQPWVLDCLSFAAAYPRVADPILLRRSGLKVERGVLPLRPYMQPPHMQHRSDRTAGRPGALLAHCQLARWGQRRPTARHVFGQHKQQHHHKRTLQRAGSAAHQSHLPAAAAVAAGQQLGQRSQLHTFSLGWSGSGSSGSSGGGGAGRGVSRAQLTAPAVRSTLLQGCTRLLGSIRMLRPL